MKKKRRGRLIFLPSRSGNQSIVQKMLFHRKNFEEEEEAAHQQLTQILKRASVDGDGEGA